MQRHGLSNLHVLKDKIIADVFVSAYHGYHNTLYIVYMYVLIIVYTSLHVMHYVYMCYVIQLHVCMAAYNVLTHQLLYMYTKHAENTELELVLFSVQ